MKQLGVALLVISCLVWLAIVGIPFLPLTLAQKAAIVPGLLILGELFFWVGALLVGREVAERYRHWLNPRFLGQRVKRLFRR
ncbi:MAG: transporter suffix domain-containing protein [Leptolyngbya sp. BL-A-14]